MILILVYRHVSCWRQSMSHCHPCIYRDQAASRLLLYRVSHGMGIYPKTARQTQ